MKKNILIVDDDHDICQTLSKILLKKNYITAIANNSDTALDLLKNSSFNLILLDVWLEGSKKNGLEILKIIKKFNPNTPVIMISGHSNIDIAVKAIKQGAFYFIEKPFKSEKLFLLIERALENAFLQNKYDQYVENSNINDDLIGNSTVIKNLKKKIKQIADTKVRILISGESGTGKKLIARIIHNESKRYDKPFVQINCALLNSKNFDKSFFGTFDSSISKLGYIQKAVQGTIYLNEICDLDNEIQGKITNFLQNETYSSEFLEGQKENYTANIRFISSTNKDINAEIENKKLRKDLLYRLNVASLVLPPIKDRREDIPLLVDNFIDKKEKKNFKRIKLSNEVYQILQTMEWPGNVTQIKNFIDWLYIINNTAKNKDNLITSKMLPKDILITKNKKIEDANYKSIMNLPIKDARKNFEKEYLINQVNKFGGNISKTANHIGMERSALHRKIKEVGIKK